jgi:hypothetical protein
LLKYANSERRIAALPILAIAVLLPAIGASIWTVRRSGIFPTQLNDSELIRGSLGETWKSASKEAAAGMVLVALAKNAELKHFLNSNGWKLVVCFVRSNPYIAKDLSPRTMGEIFAYQQAVRAPMLATC